LNFGVAVPFPEIAAGIEMMFYGAAFAVAFAAGFIAGGICQR
jgi:hypothetical protein